MQGIFSLYDLKSISINKSNNKVRGVYIWGVKYNDRYIPLYVGQANNIHERIFQHLCRWRGGEYRVPKWDDIVNPPNNQSQSFTKDSELLYIPKGPLVYLDFLANIDVQYTIQKVLENFFCCWEELAPPNDCNLNVAEDKLACMINKNRLISTISTKEKDLSAEKFAKDFYGSFSSFIK